MGLLRNFVLWTVVTVMFSSVTNELSLCLDPSLFPESIITINHYKPYTTFYTADGLGLMQCAKACLLRLQCLSFSVDLRIEKCYLHIIVYPPSLLIEEEGTVYSQVHLWPQRIAGQCFGHTCPYNSACEELETGYKCVPFECSSPIEVEHASHDSLQSKYNFGDEVTYQCDEGYVSYGKNRRSCLETGKWTPFKCLRGPSSCEEIYDCNPSYSVGGKYWMWSETVSSYIPIYCPEYSQTGYTAVGYFDLEYSYMRGEQTNYCNFSNNCVHTRYLKVAFKNISTLQVDVYNTDFFEASLSNPGCEFLPFGTVYGFSEHLNSNAHAKYDFKNTGLKIDQTKTINSGDQRLYLTYSNEGQTLDAFLKPKYSCSLVSIFNGTFLTLSSYKPVKTTATFPVCLQVK